MGGLFATEKERHSSRKWAGERRRRMGREGGNSLKNNKNK